MNPAARGPSAVVAMSMALAALGAGAAPVVRPPTGRHLAELCVATSTAAFSCGPAQVDLRANGTASVRVDDVVYHLKLNSSQVEVVVMHNVVQIDEFTAPYVWVGSTLQFDDDDRHSRYEIRFPERKR